MFTLKLYRNGPLPPDGRTVVLEVAGVWVDHCSNNIKHIHAFKKKVGVMDEDGGHEFLVGGDPKSASSGDKPLPAGPEYYDWGVLENAQGKTTEMFR